MVSDAADPQQLSVKSMVLDHLKFTQPGHKKWFVGIPHRLDKPVGGVMVVAKTPQALKQLGQQFAEHTTKKKYLAWVEGDLNGNQVTLSHFTTRDETGKKALISTEEKKDFKPCSLIYQVIKKGENRTLIEVELFTGRYHQIRAQLSYIGHPICGDTLYGAKTPGVFGLWSKQLKITHPKSGEEMIFSLRKEQLENITEGTIF